MSDSENQRTNSSVHWKLLMTASASALLSFSYAATASETTIGDTDRPTIWIELGGQLERTDGGDRPYSPPFISTIPQPLFKSPVDAERLPLFTNGGEGKITLEPEGIDWVFSAAMRYGRSNGNKLVHQQTYPGKHKFYTNSGGYFFRSLRGKGDSTDVQANSDTSHLVVDFQAGKDVGLGTFGKDSASIISLGVRFAQFLSSSTDTLKALPDNNYPSPSNVVSYFQHHHHFFTGSAHTARSFHGLGPSISWAASTPVQGGVNAGGITLDWGVNAAVLFGRQKAKIQHQTTAHYEHKGQQYYSPGGARISYTTLYKHVTSHERVRSVIVPNVGAFAGASFRYANAKVSFGYRADFFFGAIDAGFDTRKSETLGFYGPFASISVGFGG